MPGFMPQILIAALREFASNYSRCGGNIIKTQDF
jgi:hypothetical protein